MKLKELNLNQWMLIATILAYPLIATFLIVPFILPLALLAWAITLLYFSFRVLRWKGIFAALCLIMFFPVVVLNWGQFILKDYCDEDKIGLEIYDTAENVDGYYMDTFSLDSGCSFCWDAFMNEGYSFIETRVHKESLIEANAIKKASDNGVQYKGWWGSKPVYDFPMREGLYHYTYSKNMDGAECEDFRNFIDFVRNNEGYNIYERFTENNICLVAKEIAEPAAQYLKLQDYERFEHLFGYVGRQRYYIMDQYAEKTMSEVIKYHWQWDGILPLHNMVSRASCSDSSRRWWGNLKEIIPSPKYSQ